ncbi:hypothetical protein DE146DRAFT_477871 [Phaeosphaeria sp. MPI-PUGE-AT-0046c]|nr:hypothetical protein DE146DRAFT_477871 [Phaeosphaeria sp. MPI-PUGE-AT-0046c]
MMATSQGNDTMRPNILEQRPIELTSAQNPTKPTDLSTSAPPLDEVPSDLADASPFPTVLRRTSTATGSVTGPHNMDAKARGQYIDDPSSPKHTKDTKTARGWQGFEPHYGLLQCSVRSVLQEILEDMAINRSIHTWDQKLFVSSIKQLKKVVRQYMTEHPNIDMSSLLVGVVVEAITTADGSAARSSPLQNDVPGTLFLTKLQESKNAQRMPRSILKKTGTSNTTSSVNRNYFGRIVLIKDHLPEEERVALLLLLSICIRLQNEDYAYIQAFMERHLILRNDLSWPSQFQRVLPSQMNSTDQLVYKRVTLSSHLTYLKPAVTNSPQSDTSSVDQEQLFTSRGLSAGEAGYARIVKATTSVLLTIALPEKSSTKQEELDLLKLPQGSWTVMVVNCHERLSKDMEREPTQYLTPLAQFLRGLTYSLRTQNMNAESIYDRLKEQLRDADDGQLFDDERFTKSSLYHWTVRTCDELRESLLASQRYMTRAFDRKISALCGQDAHDSEKPGLLYWKAEHEAEMHALEELVSQIAALSSSVQESRNALHGVTAVLEARVALQQGERIKVLAYLATIYLPLTATSSLYSMSVLPTSATFWSFFVVLVAFLLGTALIALSLKPIVAGIRAKVQIDVAGAKTAKRAKTPRWLRFIARSAYLVYQKTGLEGYVKYYADVVVPERELKPFRWSDVFGHRRTFGSIVSFLVWMMVELPFDLLRTWPKALVREALTREVLFLRDQYYLYHSLKKNMPDLYWSPVALVRDVFRLLFVPVWCVLIVAIVGMLVVEDLLFAPVYLVIFLLSWVVEQLESD